MNYPSIPVSQENLAALAARYVSQSRELHTTEMLKLAFSCIDLTTLNATDTITHVAAFAQKVNLFEREFPGFPPVAALCTFPNVVSVVRENLAVAGVKIASVAGGFPSSMTFLDLKVEEARLAVLQGADEIDMVLPLWAFLGGNTGVCLREIRAVKTAIGDARLKVILETGLLADPEKIWTASWLALEGGADIIKTSTGKTPVSATPEAAILMSLAIKYWYQATGEMRGLKPAGGIVTSSDALIYLTIVREILGQQWMNNHLFRIGASRLSNNLLSDILERETLYF